MRSATRSTSRPSWTRSLAATGSSAAPSSRRPCRAGSGTSIRRTSADIRPRVAKQKLDAAGYKLDAERQPTRQGAKPINLKMVVPVLLDHVHPERRVHLRLVEGARDRDDDAVARPGRRVGAAEAAGSRPAGQGAISMSSSGTGPATSTRTRSSRSPRPIRSRAVAATASSRTRATTSSSRSRARRTTRRSARPCIHEMQQILYDKAPYHVLFYDAALSAWRTDRFGAGRCRPEERRTAVLRLWHRGIRLPDGPAAAAAEPSPSASTHSGRSAVTAARRRPPSHAGPERADRRLEHERQQQHALLIVGLGS